MNMHETNASQTTSNSTEWRLLFATAVAGLGTLVLAIALLLSFPTDAPKTTPLPQGFWTPILALEFAKTEVDLAFLTGNGHGNPAESMRAEMKRGQKIDMVFPFAYAGLLALYLLRFARAGVKSAWIGLVIALAIIPADLGENLVIFDILSALDNQQTLSALLPALHSATWLKWWSICFAAGFVAFGAFRRQMWGIAVLGAVTAGTLALTAMTSTHPLVAEVMGLCTAIFLIFLSIKALVACKPALRKTSKSE
jgi:hypothetical protein